MVDAYIRKILGENEKILMVARQHWFLLVGAIFLESFIILFILIVVTILLYNFPRYPVIGVGFLLLFIPIISMIKDIMDWRNRLFIVTNRRVIQTAGVFNKSVVDSSLEKVNDVKMVQSYLGRIFDFGNIEILTASEMGVNLFRYISNPIMFKTSMLNAKEHLSEDNVGGIHYSTSVPVLIEELDLLRRKGILSEQEFLEKKRELLSKL